MSRRPRKWWTLAAVSASLFLTMLDVTVVNVALPTITAELETTLGKLQWVVNSYLLVYATFLLTGGKLADLFGRRRLFILGLTLFSLASLGCAIATTGNELIAARAFQGLGAALMLPATQGIIAATFAPEERGAAFGIWAAVAGLGLALGPLVGGLLIEGIDWRWIFYINVPLGAVAIVVARLVIVESRDTRLERRLDLPALLASGIMLFAVTYGLIEGERYGWTSGRILLSFGIGVAALVLLIAVELWQRLPMIDLSLFKDSTFAGANVVSLMIMGVMIGVLFFLSIFLQHFLRYSPIETGAAFLPMTVLFMVVAPFAGKLTDRIGGRWPITAGMACLGVGVGLLARVDLHSSYWDMLPGFALAGIGIGLAMAPATTTVIASVSVDQSGVASGVLNSFRQSGGAFGVAVMGAIVASSIGSLTEIKGLGKAGPGFQTVFVSGFHNALNAGAAIAIAGGAIAALTIRTRGAPIPEVVPTIVERSMGDPLLAPAVNGPRLESALQHGAEPDTYPCPVCTGQGWFPFEPPQDPRTATCPRCYGHGKVLTGSHVAAHTVRDCPECEAKGYVELRTTYQPTAVGTAVPYESPAS